MGLVIRFPDVWRHARTTLPPGGAADVVILPVVRIERPAEKSARSKAASRRRSRPVSRS